MLVPPLTIKVASVTNGDAATGTPTTVTCAVTDSAGAAVRMLIVTVPASAGPIAVRNRMQAEIQMLRHALEMAGQIQGVTPPADTDLSALVGHTESA